MDSVVEMSNEATGLTTFLFIRLQASCEFDPHLLQRLVRKTINLQSLKLAHVDNDTNYKTRKVFQKTFCEIIKQNKGTLTEIALGGFTYE